MDKENLVQDDVQEIETVETTEQDTVDDVPNIPPEVFGMMGQPFPTPPIDAESLPESEQDLGPEQPSEEKESWTEPETAQFTIGQVFESQGCRCQRCGKDLSFDLSEVNIKLVDEYKPHDVNNLMLLCNDCTIKYDRERLHQIKRFRGDSHFKKAAEEILEGIKEMGFEEDSYNFGNTPNRFSRAYQEIFEGCDNLQAQVEDILSTTFPANGDDTMVVAKDITVFSMCPHHLLPVEYHVCVGYIPNRNGKVLGISKLTRLVEVLAKRPVLQETFTNEIVNCLTDIGVYGAIALVEGQHMCMRMRGAKALNSTITTTAVSGIFSDDRSSKSEFLSVIQDRMRFK